MLSAQVFIIDTFVHLWKRQPHNDLALSGSFLLCVPLEICISEFGVVFKDVFLYKATRLQSIDW